MHVGGFSCSVLKPNARVSLVQRAVVSSLIRFLPVILMIVKEASYPSLERRCLLQITDGAGAVEELPLELRGNSIPAHKHGRAQTLQNLLFFLNKGSTVVVILSPLGRLIDMDCHPFFVLGKRSSGAPPRKPMVISNHRSCRSKCRVRKARRSSIRTNTIDPTRRSKHWLGLSPRFALTGPSRPATPPD